MKSTADKRLLFWAMLCAVLIFGMTVVFFLTQDGGINAQQIFKSPSLKHPFGTDHLGRDMLIRSIHGFVYSFFIAFLITLISFLLGSLMGIAIGYYGGWVDEVFHQTLNFFMSFPQLILLLVLVSVFGRSIWPVACTLTFLDTLFKARMARNETQIIKNSDFVLNLRVLGAKNRHILFAHLWPHVIRLMLPLFAMVLGGTVLGVSGLSFLGFGVQPPKADIGLIMKDSMRFIDRAPWLLIFPGLLQVSVILAMNRFGEALRAHTDKRSLKM